MRMIAREIFGYILAFGGEFGNNLTFMNTERLRMLMHLVNRAEKCWGVFTQGSKERFS